MNIEKTSMVCLEIVAHWSVQKVLMQSKVIRILIIC